MASLEYDLAGKGNECFRFGRREKLFGVGNKVLSYDFTLTESTRFPASLSFPEVEATFVRLDLLSGGLCPKGYFNEGEQSRLAIDEIEIN